MSLTEVSSVRCFEGTQKVYDHASSATRTTMRFGVYLPDSAKTQELSALLWLSGLTCTHENFVTKAGSQKLACEYGMIVITPDTSPRGLNLPSEDESYDFGSGAGFYLNATQGPWSENYQMENYLIQELIPLIQEHFPIKKGALALSGHSMGGHGALTLSLNHPGLFQSVSAFSPISSPTRCPWGEKALKGYLGEDRALWERHDAACLLKAGKTTAPILVDQGLQDNFLAEQLKPELLQEAAKNSSQVMEFRFRKDFDHSYYYIATFLEEHFQWHQTNLGLK